MKGENLPRSLPRHCRTSLLGWAGALAAILTLPAADAPSTQPDKRLPEAIVGFLPRGDDEAGFQSLFGRDAPDRWSPCGSGGFALSNGVATNRGGKGLRWYTNPVFTNFIVRGEGRFENPELDTGVFVRFPNPGQDPWNAVQSGHELELGDDPEGKDPAGCTGALYTSSRQPTSRRNPSARGTLTNSSSSATLTWCASARKP